MSTLGSRSTDLCSLPFKDRKNRISCGAEHREEGSLKEDPLALTRATGRTEVLLPEMGEDQGRGNLELSSGYFEFEMLINI